MTTILKVLAEFLLVYSFQSVLFVFGIHLFSKRTIQWKPFFLCAFISMAVTYIVRELPINFGNHTLISIIVLILLSVFFLKIPVQSVVKSALLVTIMVLILEEIVILMLKLTLSEEKFSSLMGNSFTFTMAGFPVNVMLLIVLSIIYFIRKRRIKQQAGE